MVFFALRHTPSHRGSSTSRDSRVESDSFSFAAAGVVGDGLRRVDVSGLVGVDFALSWSFAEAEKVDLGLDCALKESDFCVEGLGAIFVAAGNALLIVTGFRVLS